MFETIRINQKYILNLIESFEMIRLYKNGKYYKYLKDGINESDNIYQSNSLIEDLNNQIQDELERERPQCVDCRVGRCFVKDIDEWTDNDYYELKCKICFFSGKQ